MRAFFILNPSVANRTLSAVLFPFSYSRIPKVFFSTPSLRATYLA